MKEEVLNAGPFAHEKNTVQRTMGLVLLALLPATALGLFQFGWPAIFLFVITIATALAAEAASLRIMRKPVKPFLTDGSAILTGWLLAMTLPPWAPWWIGVIGALLAIVVGKQIFGGIGQNLFNPAMVARVALLISFPLEMTIFTTPSPLFSISSPDFITALGITFGSSEHIDAVSSATTLGHYKTEMSRGLEISQISESVSGFWQQGWGQTSGSLGETSSLLILLGGLFLIYKRIITWHIPVSMLAGLFIPATLMYLVDPGAYVDPVTHLLSGAAILGAFFIATDLVTSPVSIRGQIIFGAGCGLLVYIIRTWAGYPEGVAFAVMLMNACTPLIDHYLKPRIYGRDTSGDPISYNSEENNPS